MGLKRSSAGMTQPIEQLEPFCDPAKMSVLTERLQAHVKVARDANLNRVTLATDLLAEATEAIAANTRASDTAQGPVASETEMIERIAHIIDPTAFVCNMLDDGTLVIAMHGAAEAVRKKAREIYAAIEAMHPLPSEAMIEAGAAELWRRLDLNGHTLDGVRHAAENIYLAMRSAAPDDGGKKP